MEHNLFIGSIIFYNRRQQYYIAKRLNHPDKSEVDSLPSGNIYNKIYITGLMKVVLEIIRNIHYS